MYLAGGFFEKFIVSFSGRIVFSDRRFVVSRPPSLAGVPDKISVFFEYVGISHKAFRPRIVVLHALS